MNFLIVEDNEEKRSQLKKFIIENHDHAKVLCKKSLQSGKEAIMSSDFDLLILDMSLPTFEIGRDENGGRHKAYAGREIIRQMDRLDIETPTIVVTQLDIFGEGQERLSREQLHLQLSANFSHIYRGMVYYNPATDVWKQLLTKLINKINNQ